MAEKRISRTSSKTSGIPSQKVSGATPAGIHPILQRFWSFTKDNAKKFAKNLLDPESAEEELIKAVDRDFKKRS